MCEVNGCPNFGTDKLIVATVYPEEVRRGDSVDLRLCRLHVDRIHRLLAEVLAGKTPGSE